MMGGFKQALRVFVLESQELEDIWVLNLPIGCDCIARVRSSSIAEPGGLVARKGRTFVELRLTLTIELQDGPAAAKRLAFIEGVGVRVPYADAVCEM
jgi:hypothetical protein